MLSGDCNICINGKMPSYSAICVECGLSRKNYKPVTNADRIRAMSDEELALFIHNVEAQAAETELVSYVNEWLDWLKQEAVSDG